MILNSINPYSFIIYVSLIVIISYFFNILSKRTNYPSVLMLIVLGIVIRQLMIFLGLGLDFSLALEVLGIVGLVMIVLEAVLDLKLTREKLPMILKSLLVAFLSIVGCVVLLSYVIQTFIPDLDYLTALIYSVPLSVVSSAIVIPSVVNIEENKKEFMIYESAFSDILGIMFFYFVLKSSDVEGFTKMGVLVAGNILITILISFIVSYSIIYVFQNLKSNVKLFLLISVLMMLYSLGKLMHLSSLLIIMIFGLILKNHELFIRGFLKKYIRVDQVTDVFKDFKTITVETSFIVRTLFFVIFGITISLKTLLSARVIMISIMTLLIIFGLRYVLLRVVTKDFKPQLYIASRGLISILLFFAIPEKYQAADFESGTLLFVIIATNVIMAWALIKDKKERMLIEE